MAIPDFVADGRFVTDAEFVNFVNAHAIVVTEVPVDGGTEGKIAYTNPAPGTAVTHGMTLTVGVQRPNLFLEVPDLVGHSMDPKHLPGFVGDFFNKVTPDVERFAHPTEGPNVIVWQGTHPATRVLRGSTIKIRVTPEAPSTEAARAMRRRTARQVYDRRTGRFMPEYAASQGFMHGLIKVITIGKVK